MGLLGSIRYWVLGMFGKAKALITKLWDLAKPLAKEILSEAANQIWLSLKDLFIEAIGYVAKQGLPTTEAKQKAFKDYMEIKAKEEIGQLKDRELNWIRETALGIWEKAQQG